MYRQERVKITNKINLRFGTTKNGYKFIEKLLFNLIVGF